jgi:hypothetical protein
MNHFKVTWLVVTAAVVLIACSNSGSSGAERTGGSSLPGSGGAPGNGGVQGSAGSSIKGSSGGTSGILASGGIVGSGGSGFHSTGGKTGSGGMKATGGIISTGGTKATSSGGVQITGGSKGTGGVTVDGGAGALPYKGVANSPCADRTKLGVSWYYNWTVSPEKCSGGGGGEFVPMYSNHPNNNPTPEAVASQITKLVNASYQYVLGFNEPNKTDQANMTVADAIALWPAMTSNPSILVGSPATSADGQTWFKDFLTQAQAQNLRIDFIALHWYGWNAGSCDAKASNLESYIQWAEGLPGNLPLWLTEWGCMNKSNPDEATVQAFYSGAIAMLAKHPRVERYAWYPWNDFNHLTNSDGSLTSLGTTFAAARSTR